MQNISSQQENLHRKFKHYGALHLEYRRKCIGLLPEIFKEKIYIKKGFESIFEYAAKLAGLSYEQVKMVLSLSDRFTDKPTLRSCLENGEVSVSKLAKIASVVTVANEDFWASQAKILPTRALETLVRDERHSAGKIPDESAQTSVQESIFYNNDGLFESKSPNNFVRVNNILELGLNAEVVNQLLELKRKGLDINQILLDLLKKRGEQIEQEKEQIAEEMGGETGIEKGRGSSKPSRYISVKIKRLVEQEHGTQCSIPTCSKPSQAIHHAQRFSLISSAAPQLAHDPRYLAPLCREHHQIAHSIDLKFHEVVSGGACGEQR